MSFSFYSGCLAVSVLQHQTPFVLSFITPRVDRRRLAAGGAVGEGTRDTHDDWAWHSLTSCFFCLTVACSSFFALDKFNLHVSWTHCRWDFYPGLLPNQRLHGRLRTCQDRSKKGPSSRDYPNSLQKWHQRLHRNSSESESSWLI